MNDLDDPRTLMGAAERDLRALRGMEDAVVFADEIAGFHAQQAAEKLFKVWLILLGEPYPLTHDLDHLLHLVGRREPDATRFEDLIEYNPYAVQFRYGWYKNEAAPIDRQKAVERLEALRRQVQRRLPDAERPRQLQKKSAYTCVHCTKYGIFGPRHHVAYVHRQ